MLTHLRAYTPAFAIAGNSPLDHELGTGQRHGGVSGAVPVPQPAGDHCGAAAAETFTAG